jgi:hypothetical protein
MRVTSGKAGIFASVAVFNPKVTGLLLIRILNSMMNFSEQWAILSQQTPQLIPPTNRLNELAELDDFIGLDPSLPTIDMRVIDAWEPGDNLPSGTFKSMNQAVRLAQDTSLHTGQAHITQYITTDPDSFLKTPKVNFPIYRGGTRMNVKEYELVSPNVVVESWLAKDLFYNLKSLGKKLLTQIAK